MNDLTSQEKADQALSPVQVILNLNPKHLKMIRRCAKIRGQSVEKWIMLATEASLRGDENQFDHIGIELDFGVDEIDDVYEAIFGAGGES